MHLILRLGRKLFMLRAFTITGTLVCFYMLFILNTFGQFYSQDSVTQTSNKCNDGTSCSPSEAEEVDSDVRASNNSMSSSGDGICGSSYREDSTTVSSLAKTSQKTGSPWSDSHDPVDEARKEDNAESSIESPWYHLRKEAIAFVSQTLRRGCKNLWHLTTSRVSVLLSSAAASSASIDQFFKNFEDLILFILAGEAFCGIEAVEFRQKLKLVSENYFIAFHRQNVHVSELRASYSSWLFVTHVDCDFRCSSFESCMIYKVYGINCFYVFTIYVFAVSLGWLCYCRYQ